MKIFFLFFNKGCTERSVKQFQKAKNIKATGKVDYKTAKKLKITS